MKFETNDEIQVQSESFGEILEMITCTHPKRAAWMVQIVTNLELVGS